jgi:NAD(P)H-dependent flavin oxidoreductase YrpB (nitropropane dioxygenase family)
MTLQAVLGTELPIIQAPMAGVQGSALAIAVSEAGGLGSLPCAMLGPDAIRQELAAIVAATRKPFNVNFFCHAPTTSAVHRAALKDDDARVTALTNVFTGRPARGIVNRLVRELGPICPAAPAFPLAAAAVAPLRARAERLGSGEFTSLWSGQNATGCREIPAAALTRELAALPGTTR